MNFDFLEDDNIRFILKNSLLGILVVVLLYIEVILLLKFSRKIKHKIDVSKTSALNDLKVNSFKIIDGKRKKLFLKKLVGLFTVIFILALAYVSLILIIYLFPGTREMVTKLLSLVTQPLSKIIDSIISYLPNLVSIIIHVYVFKFFIKIVKSIRDEVAQGTLTVPGFDPTFAQPTAKIIIFLSYAFFIALVFPLLPGSDSFVFKGVIALIGVLISIAGGSSFSNFLAGIILTYMKPFTIGDKIKFHETTGVVIKKGPFSIKILTEKNEEITIANNKIIADKVINYSTGKKTILRTTISIGYDVNYNLVEQLLLKAAQNTEGILDNPKAFVLKKSLDDFYITYELNFFVTDITKQSIITSNLHEKILDGFTTAEVEILSPHYRATRDGNHSTITEIKPVS